MNWTHLHEWVMSWYRKMGAGVETLPERQVSDR